MIIDFFTKRTLVSRLTITLIHFVILNLLLGSMSCDDDSPNDDSPAPYAICYVTKITGPADRWTDISYDNLDRLDLVEFSRCGSFQEVIWENDSVRKINYTLSYGGSFCDSLTNQTTILYANNLVAKIDVKIGDSFQQDYYYYEFSLQ